MLIICEECSKKYEVDENQLKGDKARFVCRKCGHLVVVRREDAIPTPSRGEAVVPNSSTSR